MIELAREHWAAVRGFFEPERPGPVVLGHVLATGYHQVRVDRWPDPRVVLARAADNVALRGDPDALDRDALPQDLEAFVEAPAAFLPRLRELRPDGLIWERVIYALHGRARVPRPKGAEVRRLGPDDADALAALSDDVIWVGVTFGGPVGLARSGLAWGAFVAGQLVSVASPFLIGRSYEDLGVVTEAAFRGRGLNPACAGRLAEDVIARGRTPSWSTSPPNTPSRRVCEKLGFTLDREDRLFVVGMELPEIAAPG